MALCATTCGWVGGLTLTLSEDLGVVLDNPPDWTVGSAPVDVKVS